MLNLFIRCFINNSTDYTMNRKANDRSRRQARRLAEQDRQKVYELVNKDDDKVTKTISIVLSSQLTDVERSIDPQTFDKDHYPGSRMIRKWRQSFLGERTSLEGNEWVVAEAARDGLMKVGETECRDKEVLALIDKEFNQVKGRSREKIVLYCARLYTRNVFVNRVVNQALRDNDGSLLETLGPYCYLLTEYLYSSTLPTYRENVFRGCQLEPSLIEQYREVIGGRSVKWLGFTSTSKSREMAGGFGCNVLFTIDLSQFTDRFRYNRPVDMSHISNFPGEEEVLLPAGFTFIVKKVEQDETTHITYIDVCGIPR